MTIAKSIIAVRGDGMADKIVGNWSPTMQLRILATGSRAVIQQLWRDRISGETEWRDVPTVKA